MTPYIFTADSITVIVEGAPHVIGSDHPKHVQLIEALRSGDDEEVKRLVASPLHALSAVFGEVEVYGGHVTYQGVELHNYLVGRILEFDAQKLPIEPLANFLANVQQNPSRRAVQDLYSWCEAGGLPITPDGCIVAYKIVREDFTDVYSGKFDNSPGKRVQVPRNQVDDNPDVTCSHGLHFCSASYLPHYGHAYNRKVVLVKVNPADVVAFPKDYNLSKARCSGYDVLEEIDATTAATFFADAGPIWGYEEEEDNQEIPNPFSVGDHVLYEGNLYMVLNVDTDGTTYIDDDETSYRWVANEELTKVEDERDLVDRLAAVEATLGIVPEIGANRIETINKHLGIVPATLDFEVHLRVIENILGLV